VRAGEFWDDPLRPTLPVDLTPEAVARRIAAFASYRSQEQNLRYFYLTNESFRPAPDDDFAAPPLPKATLYGAEYQARLVGHIRDMRLERALT
jgi:hypothetical protein